MTKPGGDCFLSPARRLGQIAKSCPCKRLRRIAHRQSPPTSATEIFFPAASLLPSRQKRITLDGLLSIADSPALWRPCAWRNGGISCDDLIDSCLSPRRQPTHCTEEKAVPA